MSPLIAVAGRTAVAGRVSRDAVAFAGRRYMDSVLRGGGEPVVVSPQHITHEVAVDLVGRFDGLLLMGGPDVDPELYGQEPHSTTYGVDRFQDDFEIGLLRAALELGVPVLAVCRGIQLVNVAMGGTLIQHIDESGGPQHRPTAFPAGAEFAVHDVTISEGSKVHKALGTTTITGSSFHHQGLDKLGDGLIAVGWSSDGLVEAVEHVERWLLGVQWHPEDTAHEDPPHQSLYSAFVRAASAFNQQSRRA
ncbi:MAG: gamma-glutamyl-gamma-aminobutyrate hydrolase family protein [Actinobacteria bacterium]|nr:gamma-glutamyl-gamma-aminobutyrate hydrolase family protein [Actinomycetota bacterium]